MRLSPDPFAFEPNPIVVGLLAAFAPQVFLFLQGGLNALLSWNPTLKRNFAKGVFAAATFNFGPQTTTLPHVDAANLAWGWCAITALGRFNPDLGGHLVLWDLGLVIRFPPGSTILIPSALLRHSNTRIQDGETRYSFTQYSSGHLFRFIYNGFRSDLAFDREASDAEKRKRFLDQETRWEAGLGMFSKLDDLSK